MKTPIKGTVAVDVYHVIERAVDEGVCYGYSRAHKHTDAPTEETLKNEIEQAVMNSLCEVLEFGD